MDAVKYFIPIAIIACGPAPRDLVVSLAGECGCPCADAAVSDAPPDVPGATIDLAAPWTRIVITPGSPDLIGADGVARDVEGCWWTPWEQSGAVTRACPAGSPTSWIVQTMATGLLGAEDCKPLGDLDGDGHQDAACSTDAKTSSSVYLVFGGAAPIVITLTASQGHCSVMQVAAADIGADGDTDVVMGSRWVTGCPVNVPAVNAWLENPGPADVRLSVHWTYHEISKAGWTMSLEPVDLNSDSRIDVVVSDRTSYRDSAGVTQWGLYGARWMEQLGDGTWMPRRIGHPAGSCSPYASPTCLRTPGDEMMLDILATDGDWLVVDGQSSGSQTDSRVMLHLLNAGTHTLIPPVPNVGHYQHAVVGDVDLDGDPDLVVSTWGADGAKSGVYWLRNNGDGTWSRGEVSGEDGTKFDNLAWLGRCVVTSEQIDQLGVIAYCPPGVLPP